MVPRVPATYLRSWDDIHCLSPAVLLGTWRMLSPWHQTSIGIEENSKKRWSSRIWLQPRPRGAGIHGRSLGVYKPWRSWK